MKNNPSLRKSSIIVLILFLGVCHEAKAGGAVAKIEQQKQIREQQMAQEIMAQRALQQQQMMQQAMQQRMVQQQAMQQRMLQQQALQRQIQQRTMQERAMGQALQQRAISQERAVQGALEQRNQAAQALQMKASQEKMRAAQNAAQQRSLAQQLSQTNADYSYLQSSIAEQGARRPPADNFNYNDQYEPDQPTETVGMAQIWDELKVSSEVWGLMIDREPKEEVVDQYIDWYKKQGVKIRKSVDHYVRMIDEISSQNDNLLKGPFKDVLKFVAIIEYDFDNGQDKDRLAEKILGEEGFQFNKKRLGL